MDKDKVKKYETLNTCFCCKKEKVGITIDNKHVCKDCNHLGGK
jgi:hypothetical protein